MALVSVELEQEAVHLVLELVHLVEELLALAQVLELLGQQVALEQPLHQVVACLIPDLVAQELVHLVQQEHLELLELDYLVQLLGRAQEVLVLGEQDSQVVLVAKVK